MVLTPLHYVAGYIVWRISGRRLSLPSLTVASMIPDIEVPILVLMGCQYPYTRLLTHSFLGSLTVDVVLTLIFTPIYLKGLRCIGINAPKMQDLKLAIISAFPGTLSHVFIDSMHHIYNPLLYPITTHSFDAFVLFGNWYLASIILQAVFLFALVAIFLWEMRSANWNFKLGMARMLIGW
mgnify:CR=1 FL=1